MVIYHIDMGYGLMIWEMTVSVRSSPISIWDILSLWMGVGSRWTGWELAHVDGMVGQPNDDSSIADCVVWGMTKRLLP